MENREVPKTEQILKAVAKRQKEGKTTTVPFIKDDSVYTVPNPKNPASGHIVSKEVVDIKGVEKYFEVIHERAKRSGVKNAEAALVNELWESFVRKGVIVPSKLSNPYVPTSSGILIPSGKDILVKSLFEQDLEIPNSGLVRVQKLSLDGFKNMQFDPDYTISGLPYLFHFSNKLSAPKGKITASGYAKMEFRKVSQEAFDKFFYSQLERIMDGPYSTADKLGKKAQLKTVQGILQNLDKLLVTNPLEYCLSLEVLFSTLADLYNIGFEISSKQMPKNLSNVSISVFDPNAIVSTTHYPKENYTQINISSGDDSPLQKSGIIVKRNYKK